MHKMLSVIDAQHLHVAQFDGVDNGAPKPS